MNDKGVVIGAVLLAIALHVGGWLVGIWVIVKVAKWLGWIA